MTNAYNPGPEYGPPGGYGPRIPPTPGASEFHHGNDYRAPLGTPIRAAADGKVHYTGAAQGYGRVVILRHTGADGATYFTVYGHMDQLPDFTLGQPIEAGQQIGKVGNSGTSSGPHLHFETVDGNTKFDNKINGTRTGVRGHVNRVDPNTFDFHGNKVFNGAGTPVTPPSSSNAQPSIAPPPNSPTGATQPRSQDNPPLRAPLPPNTTQSQPGAPQPGLQLTPGFPIPGAEGPTSLGGPNGPAPLVFPQPASNQGKRSDMPGSVSPTAALVTPTAFPLLAADLVLGKYFNALPYGIGAVPKPTELPPADINTLPFSLPGASDDDNTPAPRLGRRVVNLATPAPNTAPPLVPDAVAPASRPLGLVSGKPMPDWPVPPPIWNFSDKSSAGDDDALWQRWWAAVRN
jgi:hypothetical protein